MSQSASIEVIPGRCIGAGNCVEQSMKYFDQSDDDATVIVLQTDVDADDLPVVKRAANICPVAALVIREPSESAT